MIRTSRGVALFRRAYALQARPICRMLHEDSSSRSRDFVGFSVSNSSTFDSQFGMDMTRAPGYELAAEDDPPLVGNKKLVDFAVRHARLSSAQVCNADGYIWVGNVLYPSGIPPASDFAFPWELSYDEEPDIDSVDVDDDVDVDPLLEAPVSKKQASDIVDEKDRQPVLETRRRYTGGQARRIRKERDRSVARKAIRSRTPRRPIRKPKNDVPPDDDDS